MVRIAGSVGASRTRPAARCDDVRNRCNAALIAMALYNTISNRLRDRDDLGDQIADLSRGTADLARQVAELGRRINSVESRVESTVTRARGADDPIAAEIGELGGLVRQIADTVAAHEAALQGESVMRPITAMPSSMPNNIQQAPAAPAVRAAAGLERERRGELARAVLPG